MQIHLFLTISELSMLNILFIQ